MKCVKAILIITIVICVSSGLFLFWWTSSPRACPVAPVRPLKADDRPNVVWIVLDACRAANLSCCGYSRETSPNLDRLARAGVVFRQHYAQSTFTGFSVPSFLTGRYFPTPCFGIGFSNQYTIRMAPPGEVLFPEIMKSNGYVTQAYTALALSVLPSDRFARAFDNTKVFPVDPVTASYRMEVINEEVFQWLEQNRDKPFFVFIHVLDTHFPHHLMPPYDKWIDKNYPVEQLKQTNFGQCFERRDGQPLSEEDQAYVRAFYDGCILDADTQVGRLIDRLEALGLRDNTLLVVNSDHGQALGEDGWTVEHKGSSDQALHSTFILSGPGIPARVPFEHLTENVDIVPTLVEVMHLRTDARFDGKSLLSAIKDPLAPAPHAHIFSAPERTSYEEPVQFVLRNEEYKYEYYLEGDREYLWRVPDLLGSREDVIATEVAVAAELKTQLLAEFMPQYLHYLDLPCRAIVWDSSMFQGNPAETIVFDPFGAFSREVLCRDNRWACTAGLLWACPWEEQPPQLPLSLAVEPGTYRVMMRVIAAQDYWGRKASTFKVRIDDEQGFRHVAPETLPDDEPVFALIDLGLHEMQDGFFNVELDIGDAEHWSCLNQFWLLPVLKDGSLQDESVLEDLDLTDPAELERDNDEIKSFAGKLFLDSMPGDTPADRAQLQETMAAIGYLDSDWTERRRIHNNARPLPKRANILVDLFEARVALGDFSGAIDALCRLQAVCSADVMAEQLTGFATSLMEMPGVDDNVLKHVIGMFEKSGKSWASDYLAGVLFEKMGDMDKAVVHYNLALDCLPETGPANLARAELLERTGQSDAALDSYRAAFNDNAQDERALSRLVDLYLVRNETDKAIAAYRTAMMVMPYEPQRYDQLDALLIAKKSNDERIAFWKAFTTQKSDGARAFYCLGQALQTEGNYSAAIAAFSQAARLAPEDPVMHAALGIALAESGDYAGSVQPLRRAVEINPDMQDVRVRALLITALLEVGEYAAAMREAEDCARCGITLPEEVRGRLTRGGG